MTDQTAARRGYVTDGIHSELRREGRPVGVTKDDLPTPALLVDLDDLEANLLKMANHVRSHGKAFRPHAKTHKCPQIARRQIKAGAIGICVATVPEAEVMVASGIPGVHLTSPIASPHKVEWIMRLAEISPDLMVAIDHPQQVQLYQAAAKAAGHTLNVLVDINAGDCRTGVAHGEPALDLARTVAKCANLRLRGLQSYSGKSSHVVGFEEREAYSREAMGKSIATRRLLEKHGMAVEILSGGSTGTYDIDCQLDGVTELQVGSFIFMDLDYRRIGGRDGPQFNDFGHSLTVLTTVVSTNHADRVSLDAGIKSFATDRAFGPESKDVRGVTYSLGGDEFGILTLEDPGRPIALGDRLEFLVPHCDPTVNLYERIYACRQDRVEEVWSIMNRLPAAI